MYSGQYVLPTEPCDLIHFAVALTTKGIIPSSGAVVKGFDESFLTDVDTLLKVVKLFCRLHK